MSSIKKRSFEALSKGLSQFENGRNPVKNADFTSFKTFIKQYLNTPEPKQRRKLSEEFRKRHMELYKFVCENRELIGAESEISKTLNAVLCGDTANSDDKQLTNFFEIIGGEFEK